MDLGASMLAALTAGLGVGVVGAMIMVLAGNRGRFLPSVGVFFYVAGALMMISVLFFPWILTP